MKTKKKEIIQIENAPQIDGLVFRRVEVPDDFVSMAMLINTANAADDVPESTTVEELTHFYADPKNFDPKQDAVMAEVNGEPTAYGRMFWMDRGGDARVYRNGVSIPLQWRAKGIGRALLAHLESRAIEVAKTHSTELPKFHETSASDSQPKRAALLERAGYKVERYGLVMKVPLDKPIPAPQLPSGIEIRAVKKDDLRLIWEAVNEAFLDHWGFVVQTEEDFARWASDPEYDKSLWKVAWDGEQVAGVSLNVIYATENAEKGIKWGWVDDLGVRRPWRRQGLARALLHASHAEFKARGMEFSVLAVDYKNPNQALHLYQSCGYETIRQWNLYRKELRTT